MVKLLPFCKSDACTMVGKFLNMVVSQHGLQDCIIIDYDTQFLGHFWDELMSLLDTTLTFGMALYP